MENEWPAGATLTRLRNRLENVAVERIRGGPDPKHF